MYVLLVAGLYIITYLTDYRPYRKNNSKKMNILYMLLFAAGLILLALYSLDVPLTKIFRY